VPVIKIDLADGAVFRGLFSQSAADALTRIYTRQAFEAGDAPIMATHVTDTAPDCPSHGPHPHDGTKCLDCPECMDSTVQDRLRELGDDVRSIAHLTVGMADVINAETPAYTTVPVYHHLFMCPLNLPRLDGYAELRDLVAAYEWVEQALAAGPTGRPSFQVLALQVPQGPGPLAYVTANCVWRHGVGDPMITGNSPTHTDQEVQRHLRLTSLNLAARIAQMRGEPVPTVFCTCADGSPDDVDIAAPPYRGHVLGTRECRNDAGALTVLRP